MSLTRFFLEICSIKKLISRILQILAFFIFCGFWLMIIHKGNADFSVIYQENPDDFWKAVGRYLITNLARG